MQEAETVPDEITGKPQLIDAERNEEVNRIIEGAYKLWGAMVDLEKGPEKDQAGKAFTTKLDELGNLLGDSKLAIQLFVDRVVKE